VKENLPVLKDWKSLVEKQMNNSAYTESDILNIIRMCTDYQVEIQPVNLWMAQQQGFINQMYRIFNDMYFTMFGKQPPPRPTEMPITEVILDTPERRKQEIRRVALAMTKPGDDITDEAIFEELKRRGMKINALNPTATISTIMNGFKPQFEKLPGKRGVFKRQQ
jgi:hypothetical protein